MIKRWKKKFWGIMLSCVLIAAMLVPAMATENTASMSESSTAVSIDVENDGGSSDAEIVEVTEGNPEETEITENDIVTLSDPDEPVTEETGSGPEVTGVAITPQTVTLNVIDQTTQLTVATTPDDVEIESATWSISSGDGVVTVDSTGKVTAKKAGTATISVTVTYGDESYTDSCTVTVSYFSKGFHQAPDSSDWYYYTGNGTVDTSLTSVVKDTSGVLGKKNAWWNIVKGKVTPGETVAKNENGWWYINSSGMVDFNYTGFAKNSNGSWYCEGGKVTFSKNSVEKDTTGAIGAKGNWYYVVGSKVQSDFTGLANYKNANGWWYIKNGKVDFTANTVAKNKNGWYYVDGGKVQFGYTGFGTNSNGKWYIEKGKVTFKKNSVIKDTTGAIGSKGTWWYVVGSKVQTSFTGLANYSNENGWWYIKNGKVDFNANTVAKNKNGWYYVTGGKVQFGFTGLANYKNENGWWYIKKGKVDFSANTVAKNKNGWYYVKNGKVDFSFNGIASNSNGSWVIKNGKVDFSYNGNYTYSGITYSVTNGKAALPLGMSQTMYTTAQNQSSSTKWLLVVDITNCKVGVFKGSKGNWAPQKYWDCTTGKSSTPTIKGSYTIYDKGKSFGDGTYTCWYYNRFHNGYMLHSVLYNPGSMTSIQEGRLGMHISHGCVRVTLNNAKWVYDNIPYGTKIYLY